MLKYISTIITLTFLANTASFASDSYPHLENNLKLANAELRAMWSTPIKNGGIVYSQNDLQIALNQVALCKDAIATRTARDLELRLNRLIITEPSQLRF